jgi:hypothetical protein
LECIISIIFHIQDEFKYYYHKFLPLLIEQIKKTKDTNTKRVAIDAIYSIGAHLSYNVLSHKDELLALLDVCRTDKNQPVRAAAQETIKLLKDLDQQQSAPSQYDDNEPSDGDILEGEINNEQIETKRGSLFGRSNNAINVPGSSNYFQKEKFNTMLEPHEAANRQSIRDGRSKSPNVRDTKRKLLPSFDPSGAIIDKTPKNKEKGAPFAHLEKRRSPTAQGKDVANYNGKEA